MKRKKKNEGRKREKVVGGEEGKGLEEERKEGDRNKFLRGNALDGGRVWRT